MSNKPCKCSRPELVERLGADDVTVEIVCETCGRVPQGEIVTDAEGEPLEAIVLVSDGDVGGGDDQGGVGPE